VEEKTPLSFFAISNQTTQQPYLLLEKSALLDFEEYPIYLPLLMYRYGALTTSLSQFQEVSLERHGPYHRY
jgi:hypothetical protein